MSQRRPSNPCPAQNLLKEFLEASLDDRAQHDVISHVEQCADCEAKLKKLSDDTSPFPPVARDRQEQTSDWKREIGTTIADYVLVEKIGEGGMGCVYRARHKKLDRDFAVKLIANNHHDAFERFEREINAIGRLVHPHIVAASHAGEHEGRQFLAMEYIPGANLADILDGTAGLSIANACEVVYQVGLALSYAHDQGVLHRDIKPSNILLARDGEVKLTDFGLAKFIDQRRDLTHSHQLLGTPGFIAPEHIRDAALADIRTDIFALGATFHQLLIGRQVNGHQPALAEPFAIASPSRVAVLERHPAIPVDLLELLDAMLATDPQERPATVPEALQVVARHRGGSSLALLQSGSLSNHSAYADTVRPPDTREHEHAGVVPQATSKDQPARSIGRRPLYFWFAAIALAVVGGTSFWIFASKGPQVVDLNAVIYTTQGEQTELRGTIRDREPPLPLNENDQVELHVSFSAPAYAYVVWIGTDGAAIPIYPWPNLRWEKVPLETAQTELVLPKLIMGGGQQGMESVFILVRSVPLPDDVDLESQFAQLPKQTRQLPTKLVFFENGKVVGDHAHRTFRAPIGFIDSQEDAIVETNEMISRRLSRDFEQIVSMSFACYGSREDSDEVARSRHDNRLPNANKTKTDTQPTLRFRSFSLSKSNQPGAATWIDRAAIEVRAGDDANAIRHYQRALSELDSNSDSFASFQAYLLSQIGRLSSNLGRFTKARESFEQSLAIAQAEGYAELIMDSLNQYAQLLRDQGEYERAIGCVEEALSILDQIGSRDKPRRAVLQGNLATYLAEQGNPRKLDAAHELAAASHALLAEAAAEGNPNAGGLLHMSWNTLGYVAMQRGEFDAALQWYEKALERRLATLPETNPLTARSREKLADALLAKGQVTSAILQYELALKNHLDAYSDLPNGHRHLVRTLNGLGRALAVSGDLETAKQHLFQANAMETKIAASFASLAAIGEGLNFLTYRLGAADELLSLLSHHLASWDPAEFYNEILPRKHCLYHQYAKYQLALVSASPEAREAFERCAAIDTRLSAFAVATSTNKERREPLLQQLLAQRESLQRQYQATLATADVVDGDQFKIEDVQNHLADDTAIIDFVRFKKYQNWISTTPVYGVFVTLADDVHYVEIANAAAIEDAIENWRTAIVNETNTSASARELAVELWQPIKNVLPDDIRRIIVCPDGGIAAVPFAAIPDSSNGKRTLIDRYRFMTVPGVGSKQRERRSGADRILLVGNIQYAEQAKLPGASAEIAAITELALTHGVQTDRLDGPAATIDRFISQAGQYSILHLATHGGLFKDRDEANHADGFAGERTSVFSRNPFFVSGIFLQPSASDSGYLSAQMIAQRQIPAELVVLSACETALGDTAQGQGVFGLQQAFHLSGSQHVVGSQWRVDDALTNQFMTHFYSAIWRDGRTVPEALRSAQMELRAAGQPPLVWAAFTCSVGEINKSVVH